MMASKFRNLIASKIRRQIMASGSLNQGSNPPPSLQDLEVKMRLAVSPNPRLPFRISLQFPGETKHQTKGQVISEENFGVFKFPKNWTQFLEKFLPGL